MMELPTTPTAMPQQQQLQQHPLRPCRVIDVQPQCRDHHPHNKTQNSPVHSIRRSIRHPFVTIVMIITLFTIVMSHTVWNIPTWGVVHAKQSSSSSSSSSSRIVVPSTRHHHRRPKSPITQPPSKIKRVSSNAKSHQHHEEELMSGPTAIANVLADLCPHGMLPIGTYVFLSLSL